MINQLIYIFRDTIVFAGMAKFFSSEKASGYRLVKSLEQISECTIEIRSGDGSTGSAFSTYSTIPTSMAGRGRGAAAAPAADMRQVLPPKLDNPKVECAVKLKKGDIVKCKVCFCDRIVISNVKTQL